MAIKSIVSQVTGLSGVVPSIIYIDTDNTIAEVTAAGFLNDQYQAGASPLSESMMALVTTKTSPSAVSTQTGYYNVVYSAGNWSLVSAQSTLNLPSGQIFVGNSSGVAAAVAMSGDIGISNTGVTSIQAGSIVNADINASAAIAYSKLASLPSGQILVGNGSNVPSAVSMSQDATIANTGALTIANGAVSKAKLATLMQPAAVIKFASKHNEAGGSATVTITATGAVATDLAFVNIESSANAVSIQKVTISANTITVLCSGDPGVSVFAWQALTLTP